MKLCGIVCAVICGCCLIAEADAQSPAPIAHWKLAGDARDSGSSGLHGENHGVKFETLKPGPARPVGVFGGRGEFISVPHAKPLGLGAGDFSISLWLHTDKDLDDDLGDLVSKFDPASRTGFHLSLRNNTGTTNSLSNQRQLQFGIDNGTEPVFTDVGRPGKSIYGFSMTVFDGQLYVGTCEPEQGQSGRVYRYGGKSDWIDCGAPDGANSVSSLAVFDGRLYAGTAKYRLAGSALTESDNPQLGGKIYRYDGEQKWVPCGQLPQAEAVGGMTVYKGRLYATSLYRPAGFFRYEGGEKWETLANPNGKRTQSLTVYNGYLWSTGYDEGNVYRFDGETWTDTGRVGDNTQTYAFAVHHGQLCVATWPSGRVFRLTKQDQWEDMGRLGEELEVMGMMVHNGAMYAGTLPLAGVFRYNGDRQWSLLHKLDLTETKYRRVWTVGQFDGKVFWTTLPTGHIFAMEAGRCVTFDRELPAGWRHVAGVKQGGRLRLYVDGQKVAESSEFDPARLNLTNEKPLLIGAGSGDFFNGRVRDVQIHGQALTDQEIGQLAKSVSE